jgi:lysyl-tRNA synthetase class 1
MLRWLYSRKSPDQSFELAFNTEIYRQYDEYDAEHTEQNAIPFRQVVGFGQIVQWQEDKLRKILDALKLSYAEESILSRLPLAKNWLMKYNPDEMIVLNKTPNIAFVDMLDDGQKELIQRLHDALKEMGDVDISELEALVYAIPKSPEFTEAELKKAQRAFFKNVYNLLISKDAGPRLGTFLWAVDREKVLSLLNIKK